MTETAPGGAKETPLYMRIVRDDDGIKWGNVLVMVAVPVLAGYLHTRAQRAGGRIDFERELRMKAALVGERLGNRITELGVRLSLAASRAYDRAKPV